MHEYMCVRKDHESAKWFKCIDYYIPTKILEEQLLEAPCFTAEETEVQKV